MKFGRWHLWVEITPNTEESEPIVIAKWPCESASQPKRAKIAVDEQVLALEKHKVVTLEYIASALEKLAG